MAPGMWSEPMTDLTDDQADRLESAHACFARGDGVARARLLAALAAEVPPSSRSPRTTRSEMITRYAARTAAAALLLSAAVAWHASQPKAVFAQLAQAMSRAKGFN